MTTGDPPPAAAVPGPAPVEPRVGWLETLGFFFLMVIANLVLQVGAGICCARSGVTEQNRLVVTGTCFAIPLFALALAAGAWITCRMLRVPDWRRYCGLVLPRNKKAWLWIPPALAVVCGMSRLWTAMGYPEFTQWELDTYAAAGGIWKPCFMLVVVAVAPFWEELLFRGFLYKGWSGAAERGCGAFFGGIVMPALIWAGIHLFQYPEWYLMVHLGTMGVILGCCRRATGSLLPCIVIHLLNNLIASVLVFQELARRAAGGFL